MLRNVALGSIALVMVLAVASCKKSDPAAEDGAVAVDGSVGGEQLITPPDKGVKPDLPPATGFKVAAVQYGSGDFSKVAGAKDDLTALQSFIKEARKNGAQLAVVPEYSVDQTNSEPSPKVGDLPATDARWKDGTIIKSFARTAIEQSLTVVFNVISEEGGKLYNTNVAVGADGKVLARHFKFQLFGSESKQLTAGTSIDGSMFQTPAGRAGLLVCADVQCIIGGMVPVTDQCDTNAIALLKDYFSAAKKPDMVLLSSVWTVGGTGLWAAVNVQQKIAKDGSAYVVAANTTQGQGKGGGIYKPGGEVIVGDTSGTPLVLYAELPLKK